MKQILLAGIAAAVGAVNAAVPLKWTATPSSPPYMPPPVPHGSTIELTVELEGYTSPPIAAGADVRLWFQTNGMGSAWYSAPASVTSNTVSAVFGPAQDTGADRINCFLGAPSNIFAAVVLRLSGAPGFSPNALPLPVQVLDFAAVEIANAPWPSAEDVAAAARAAADAATNYTDRAVAAAESRITNSLPRCDTAAPSWQVPGDWRIGYILRTSQESSVFNSLATNAYYQVFSNVTESAETTLAAVLAPVALDRLSAYAPTGVTYYAVSPGVTIAGNVATAATGGVYRVRAEDPATGQARYVDIPLDHRTRTGETVEYYFADAANQQ